MMSGLDNTMRVYAMTGTQWGVIDKVLKERSRQESLRQQGKFLYTCADSDMMSTDKLAVLVEEVGEVARAILNVSGLAKDRYKLYSCESIRAELVQVAA